MNDHILHDRRHLLGFAVAAFAWYAARSPTRAEGSGPDAPIAALNAGLTTIMQGGRSVSFVTRFDQLAPAVDGAFDLPTILRACVGPRWESLPEADRTVLLDVFRRFTIASYVSNFDEANGERFEISPGARMAGGDEVIRTSIIPVQGTPNRIDYVMRPGPRGWRAVDVLLDGSISRVAVQRSDFRSLIDANGAAALIASLRRKVADLSGGTLGS